jgi:ankyrin repeat protein
MVPLTLTPSTRGARTLLHEAVRGGNEASAAYLLQWDAVRAAVLVDAKRLLSAAARRGSVALMRLLLASTPPRAGGGQCPLAVPGVLEEALWQAAYAGHLPAVDFLMCRVEAHAASAHVDWGRVLGIGAYKDRRDVVARLLREAYVLDHATVDGNTVLRWACHNGHTALVARLLQHPAVVAAADAHRNNAARGAAAGSLAGHRAIVRMLLALAPVVQCERAETRALAAGPASALVNAPATRAASDVAAAGAQDQRDGGGNGQAAPGGEGAPQQQELKFYSLLAIAAVRQDRFLIQELFDQGVHAGPREFLAHCRWVPERADGANAPAAEALLRACWAWSRRKALLALRHAVSKSAK